MGCAGSLCRSGGASRHSSEHRFQYRDNHGVGYFEVNQKKGWRWNTAKAFLRPTCFGRPNFELWTGAQVSRLLIEPASAHTPDALQRRTGVEWA
jgi:choline dehydrogenase